MAEHLIPDPGHVVSAALMALAFGVTCAPAAAQMDPMRPPDAPSAVSGNMGISVLKSILISDQRTEAVIGDKTVQPGGMFGSARVERITASEVVLRDEHGSRTLKLFPGIEKHVIGSEASNGDGAKRNSREKHKK